MPFQKHLLLCFLIAFFLPSSHAFNTLEVGGKDGWTLNPSESYANWAGRLRFQINDSLHFKYDGSSDSVLVVNKGDYDGCNSNSPITKLEGGDSVFKFDRSGPFYFITGNKSNCDRGQKLIVVVLAVRYPPPPPSAATPPRISPSPAVSPAITPSPSAASPVISPSPAASPVISPSPSATSPASPPSEVISPASPPSETPVLTPPANSPGGGSTSPGGGTAGSPPGNNPSADTTSPPSPSAATRTPVSGAIIASVVTIVFGLWSF